MKTSDLLAKAKKEGLKSLTVYELRRLSNIAWREDIFSLNGLVKYVQTTDEQYLSALCDKIGIKKEVITVKWLLTNCDPNQLKKQAKDEKTGKLVSTDEKKEFFSLWFVSGTLQRFHATVQAKAQSSGVVKVKETPKAANVVEETKKEADATAKKVQANKRSNQQRKNAKKAA